LQQPVLQHCLPLQQLSFGVDAAAAVPINAARLTINKRYFIKFSCLDFLSKFGHAISSRAEPLLRRTRGAAAEQAAVASAQ
jgi:hypothetical protein